MVRVENGEKGKHDDGKTKAHIQTQSFSRSLLDCWMCCKTAFPMAKPRINDKVQQCMKILFFCEYMGREFWARAHNQIALTFASPTSAFFSKIRSIRMWMAGNKIINPILGFTLSLPPTENKNCSLCKGRKENEKSIIPLAYFINNIPRESAPTQKRKVREYIDKIFFMLSDNRERMKARNFKEFSHFHGVYVLKQLDCLKNWLLIPPPVEKTRKKSYWIAWEKLILSVIPSLQMLEVFAMKEKLINWKKLLNFFPMKIIFDANLNCWGLEKEACHVKEARKVYAHFIDLRLKWQYGYNVGQHFLGGHSIIMSQVSLNDFP